MATVEDTLQLIRRDIQKSSEENKRQYDDLSRKIDDFANKFNELEKKFEDIDEQHLLFYDQFDDIKGELNRMKQKEISMNLIIKGMKEAENETQQELETLTHQLMTIIGLQDIGKLKSVRRIGAKVSDKPRLILLETNELQQKKAIIENKRKHKVNASQIIINDTPLGDSSTNIYIDEQLTQYTARLLTKCRQLRSEMSIKYVWTSNGTIYMRTDDNAPAIMVKNDTDIDAFKSKHTKPIGRKRKADKYVENESDSDLPVQRTRKKQYQPRTTVTRSASLNTRFMEARETFMTDKVADQRGAKQLDPLKKAGRGKGGASEN